MAEADRTHAPAPAQATSQTPISRAAAPGAAPETIRNPDIDHERSDLPLAPIAWTAAGVAALLGLVPVLLLLGFPNIGSDVSRGLMVEPPHPRLQTNPRADLASQLSRQRSLLNSYGWVDRARGVTHVPIATAMKRAAEQGIDGFPKESPGRP